MQNLRKSLNRIGFFDGHEINNKEEFNAAVAAAKQRRRLIRIKESWERINRRASKCLTDGKHRDTMGT